MTQEKKRLLLKDLCARLPYTLKVNVYVIGSSYNEDRDLKPEIAVSLFGNDDISIKPYLRPLSSMTEEEWREFSVLIGKTEMCVQQRCRFNGQSYNWWIPICLHLFLGLFDKCIDWLNSHHFDYRGLIEKGLALEAPEGMYEKESV